MGPGGVGRGLLKGPRPLSEPIMGPGNPDHKPLPYVPREECSLLQDSLSVFWDNKGHFEKCRWVMNFDVAKWGS